MAKDPVTDSLVNLKADLPRGRENLSEQEKDALIKTVGGPRTTASLVKAKKELPLARIPFVFSSLDAQAVQDILVNDMAAALLESHA